MQYIQEDHKKIKNTNKIHPSPTNRKQVERILVSNANKKIKKEYVHQKKGWILFFGLKFTRSILFSHFIYARFLAAMNHLSAASS